MSGESASGPVKRRAMSIRARLRFARALGPFFPVALALLLSVAALADAFVQPFMSGLETRTFDLMLRMRFAVPPPDPDLVVIDIDEASLSKMAPEYGRWPWPRAVLAEALDAIEAQRPRAVFFDILFADPDTLNPGSDALFNEAVARSPHGYYAMLRLDRSRDAKSELRASQVPGAVRAGASDAGDPALAMILPRFPAILNSGRVGMVGADPDPDGVVRYFSLYEQAGDWRIPSLPLQVAKGLGVPIPEERQILMNWRGGPFAYRFVSFADVHADALKKDKRRDPREFSGKIVLIGSTAPGLFDLKATPMARVHPGVEILATAIDNLRHADYYRSLGKLSSLAVSLALLWALAFSLRWLSKGLVLGPVSFGVQGFLLVIAYVSLNVSRYYADLVAPVAFGLTFIVAANLRANLREWAAQSSDPEALALERGQHYRVLLLIIDPARATLRGRTRTCLIDRVCASRTRARLADPPYLGKGVLGADFAGLTTLYWLVPAEDEASGRTAAAERAAMVEAVRRLERSGVQFTEQEAEFEWGGQRAGVVGEILINALQGLRRLKR